MSETKRPTCEDRTHGITWRDSGRGPGAFCRQCGKAVLAAEVDPRTAWQRLHDAASDFRRDVVPLYPGSVAGILREIEALKADIEERRL